MVARVAAGGRGCHDGGGLSAGDGGRGSGIDGEGWLHLRLQRRRCRDGVAAGWDGRESLTL